MQVSTSVHRVVAAPPSAVFALALDPAAFAGLFRGFGPVPALRRIVPDGPPVVGATRRLENSDGSRPTERITAFDPPHLHAYTLEGLRPPLSWLTRGGAAEWRFAAQGDGTRIEWRYAFSLTSALAWPLAWPVVAICMHQAMRRCLAALATRIEADGEAA